MQNLAQIQHLLNSVAFAGCLELWKFSTSAPKTGIDTAALEF